MILSFAWTTPAVVIGEKTETRRAWSPKTIAKFQKAAAEGTLVDAWDRSPRFGGKCFGQVRILKIIEDEPSETIPQESYKKEGFHILSLLAASIGGASADDVWRFWKRGNVGEQTVVCFELASLNDYGQELQHRTFDALFKLKREPAE